MDIDPVTPPPDTTDEELQLTEAAILHILLLPNEEAMTRVNHRVDQPQRDLQGPGTKDAS